MGGKEQVTVWMCDTSDLTWWLTSGSLSSTIYANCYSRDENRLCSRHPDFATLVIL